ncbi:hypothetical protein [Comamonas odontotermitis]|uniref:hypothetical protein n=1 Tax=Comamonas odontotermitis TaxID=379895 RepID=UPI001CC5971B|nr:hypothetical protein [Comamonas odontotermitis]UBB16930.1 hypothetical protein LAD35_19440 [Comamonas odontotermitis]
MNALSSRALAADFLLIFITGEAPTSPGICICPDGASTMAAIPAAAMLSIGFLTL